jgi:hypothetical protein
LDTWNIRRIRRIHILFILVIIHNLYHASSEPLYFSFIVFDLHHHPFFLITFFFTLLKLFFTVSIRILLFLNRVQWIRSWILIHYEVRSNHLISISLNLQLWAFCELWTLNHICKDTFFWIQRLCRFKLILV